MSSHSHSHANSLRKKGKSRQNIKPRTQYVHPALSLRPSQSPFATPSSSSSSTTSKPSPFPTSQSSSAKSLSVNEHLDHLRRTQNPRVRRPQLSNDVEEVRIGRHLFVYPLRRDVAGPPPPKSWTEANAMAAQALISSSRTDRPKRISTFPGLTIFPEETSLFDQALRHMARDFSWHEAYDHRYLALIPHHYKMLLLSYIVSFGCNGGISVRGLKALFPSPSEDPPEVSDNDYITRLDLGCSLDRSLSIDELAHVLIVRDPVVEEVPDSWDSEIPTPLNSPLRFPALTHLSLAYPGPGVSWPSLIQLSRHLGALTHLSLAYWPEPSLPTSLSYRLHPSPINFHERNEPSLILQQLSRNTQSLQWLSLEGCQSWYYCLAQSWSDPHPTSHFTREMYRALAGMSTPTNNPGTGPVETTGRSDAHLFRDNRGIAVEWNRAWRHLTYINVNQGEVPRGIKTRVLWDLYSARNKEDARHYLIRSHMPDGMMIWRRHSAPFERWASAFHRGSSSIPEPEEYRVVSPDNQLPAREMEAEAQRIWIEYEAEAVCVMSQVKLARSQSSRPRLIVDHGWNKQDLIDVGYEEQALFETGF